MKYLVLVMVVLSLFMGGCSSDIVYPKQVEVANYLCSEDGGWKYIDNESPYGFAGSFEVQCQDGSINKIKYYTSGWNVSGNSDPIVSETVNSFMKEQ